MYWIRIWMRASLLRALCLLHNFAEVLSVFLFGEYLERHSETVRHI